MTIKSERADYFQPDTQVVSVENVEILLEKAVEAERERIDHEFKKRANLVVNPIETPEGTVDGSFYQIFCGNYELVLTPTKTDKTTDHD